LLLDAAFTWSWNHFTETPATNVYNITDNTQIAGLLDQRGAFIAQGISVLEPYDSQSKGVSGDMTKTVHFLGGTHSFNLGYTWQFPTYDEHQFWSGPKYQIPALNATGGSPGYGSNVAGQMTDSNFSLSLAGSFAPGDDQLFDPATNPNDTTCTLCPYMAVPGYSTPVRVVLQQTRGRFDGGVTKSSGKYHAAYINDAWQMSKYVTLNVGVRWEQQRLIGNNVQRPFVNMWSPRVGLIVDPKGDRKSKFYANFGRYAFVLPLDAAIRALSNEEDFQNSYWSPASTTNGCPAGTPAGAPCAALNSFGSTDFVGDQAHLLNQADGGIPINAGALITGGEPFAPGTRMEYTDEFVVGYDREFKGGIVASVRYIDRRLKRVIEDEGGISVEEFNTGTNLNYVIGNPNASQDIFVNPNEIVFDQGVLVPTSQQTASNLPAACIDANGNPTPFVAWNQFNGFAAANNSQSPAGSVCLPAVNTGTWTDSSGNLLPGCTSLNQSKQGGCASFGGEFYPDGKPDTYKDPKREYEAVEFEVTKSFSHNWALSVNYRLAQLRGNYEGAFRNDNAQADPGISSLFDFTEGSLGLLANQQSIGFLSTDRKHVLNAHSTYVLPGGKLKGFVIGAGLTVQSGIPLSTLVAQQAYQNQGEVPIFGRGDLGRTPVTGIVDAHVEYPWKINERMSLNFAFDMFNIANSTRQTNAQQFYDLGFGLKNQDFGKPVTSPTFQNQGFVDPFSSRVSIKFVF